MSFLLFLDTLLYFYKHFTSRKGDRLIIVTLYKLIQCGFKVLEDSQVNIRLFGATTVTFTENNSYCTKPKEEKADFCILKYRSTEKYKEVPGSTKNYEVLLVPPRCKITLI